MKISVAILINRLCEGINLSLSTNWEMRRVWRWRFCAVSWVAGAYVCVLAIISIINLTDPSFHRRPYSIPTESIQHRGTWGMAVSRGGGRGSRLPWCKPLKFRDPPGPNTALVSFPGSGNTWLRYLLQQATGIFTGSVYKDYALLKNGFPAESVSNGTVIVVKTHEWGPEIRKTFQRAILVLRDPYQSIMAEFNRQSGGHIGHAPSDKYKRDKGKYWDSFTRTKAMSWMNTTLDWLTFQGALHLVFYEDLLDNLAEEMRRIIEFLDLNVDEKDFDCMMKHKDGIYKRRRRPLPFEPFSRPLRLGIEKCKNIVDKAIREFLASNAMNEVLPKLNTSLIYPIRDVKETNI